MPQDKVILLVEATVKPEHREAVLAVAAENLPLTRAEAGVEAFYQTARQGDPDILVFFEVFQSEAAHELHMQEEYTRKVFETLQGRLAAPPTVTRLIEL